MSLFFDTPRPVRQRKAMSFYKSKTMATSSRRKRRPQFDIVRVPRTVKYRQSGIKGASSRKELKFFDITVGKVMTNSLIDMLSGTQSLNAMVQGVNQSERIGNKIVVKSVQCKGYFKSIGAVGGAGNVYDNIARVIVFVDHQCNGIATVAGDLLEVVSNINSPFNVDNSAQFTVLYDIRKAINQQVVWDTAVPTSFGIDHHDSFKFYKKMNMETKFNATAGALASIVTNSINVMGYLEDALCAVSFFGYFRVRYTD